MSLSASERFLDRLEKHYFFELERRDRLHGSLRLLATMMLAILGAAWLLVSNAVPDTATQLAADLGAMSAGLAAAAGLASMIGLLQAGPIATEDHYEIVLHENLIENSQNILRRSVDGGRSVSDSDEIRGAALAAFLSESYAAAALANLALNEALTPASTGGDLFACDRSCADLHCGCGSICGRACVTQAARCHQ